MTGIPRRAVLGLTAGVLGSTALAGATHTKSYAAGGTPVALDQSNFLLHESEHNLGAINKVSREIPGVSINEILDSGSRALEPATVGLPNEVRAWHYTDGAATTLDWYPQGITSNFDATGEDTLEGRSVLLTSWYDKHDTQGVRIAFTDITDPDRPTFRDVLLVDPFINNDGHGDFLPVPVHAGGLVWYRNWLFVADTWNGIRVFDLRELWQVSTDRPDTIGRADDGSYHAFEHHYALPQMLHYTSEAIGGESDVRWSALSLDRTSNPHSVVVAEYRNSADEADGQAARIISFPLDPVTGLLEAENETAVANAAYDVDINSMQSATRIGGTYVISRSAGTSTNGHLVTFAPPEEVTWYRGHFPVGTEDLSTWGSRDELWTLAEHPDQRSIVAVRPSDYL